MKLKDIKTVNYTYGDEERIKKILYESKEPLLIKIKNFSPQFTIDYFMKNENQCTSYDIFENEHWVSNEKGELKTILSAIKENKPYRIFAQNISRKESTEIEAHVPLWQTIPTRLRYFQEQTKVIYFFGGKGSATAMHFDREHCCNLHLCLSGKKEVLLFTEDQHDHLYKLPYIGDSLIDFSQPLETIEQHFPKIKRATGYQVILESGDMLFMPKNCWHYTKYLDASSAAAYVFYPKKILHYYGFFTGYFCFGYKTIAGFNVYNWPIFRWFNEKYACADGQSKRLFKVIESVTYAVMLPILSIYTLIVFKIRKPKRIW